MSKLFRHILVLAMIAAMTGFGCDDWPGKDSVRPAPEAPPAPINLAAQVSDRSLDLSWEMLDSSAVASFRIYQADDPVAEFHLVGSTSDYTMTVIGLPFDQPLRFRVTAVSPTGIEGTPSAEVTAVAGLLSLVLDGGDEYTRDLNVSVRINVPGSATYVEMCEDPQLAGAVIEPFATLMTCELSRGDGVKTVYARITFADGSVAAEIISDDIELDTEARIGSVSFSPSGQVLTTDDIISFFLDANGELGGTASVSIPGASRIDLSDDGVAPDVTADDGIYSAHYIVPVALSVFESVVTGSFRDAAGNAATATQSVERLTIETSTPPDPIILAVALADSVYAHMTWTESTDDDFGSYRIYRSISPGLNASADHLRIAIISQRNTVSYDDYLPDSGVYYYRIFVFDTQGLSAGSNEVVVTR
jgi:fibronectin type 3 domain-containing protein